MARLRPSLTEGIVVADIGGWTTRVGIVNSAGKEISPTSIFPTAVAKRSQHRRREDASTLEFPNPWVKGRPAGDWNKPGQQGNSLVVGREAMNLFRQETGSNPVFPIEHGVVTNWDALENLYFHVYHDYLKRSPADLPLVYSMNASSSIAQKSQILEILLEKVAVPRVIPASDCLLALYSTGGSTGTVVMAGHGTTHAMSIYHGTLCTHGGNIGALRCGGYQISQILSRCMAKRGYRLHTYASDPTTDFMAANRLKERQCYVSDALRADLVLHRNMLGRLQENLPEDLRDYYSLYEPGILTHGQPFDVVPAVERSRRRGAGPLQPANLLLNQQQRGRQERATATPSASARAAVPSPAAEGSAAAASEAPVGELTLRQRQELEDPVAPLVWATSLRTREPIVPFPPVDRMKQDFRDLLVEEGVPESWVRGPPCPAPYARLEPGPAYEEKFITRRREFSRTGNLLLADGGLGQMRAEQFLAPELLFNPKLYPTVAVDYDERGVAELTRLAAEHLDADIRAEVTQNVVTAGGSSLFPGFARRLHDDLGAAWDTQRHAVVDGVDQCMEVWNGGAVVCGMPTFQQMCITSAELDEYGPMIMKIKGTSF